LTPRWPSGWRARSECVKDGGLNRCRVKSKIKTLTRVFPWLAFTISGLEQERSSQCQFKVNGYMVSCLSAAWNFGVLVL